MEHIGIDLGGKESQVCVRTEDGTVLLERRMRTAALKKWVAGRPPSRIVMETCTESFSIADGDGDRKSNPDFESETGDVRELGVLQPR